MKRALALLLLMTTIAARSRAEDVQSKTLANGMLWLHRPVSHNQITAFYLFFPSGVMQEPAEKAGLTDLMTSVMFKGAAKLSALQLAQQIESLGAALDADSDDDSWNVSGQVTSDKFAPLFNIVRAVLLAPTFPAEEFKKEKEAHLNAIRSKKERIFNVAYEKFQPALFGSHPYGRPGEGTAESVARITREDLAAWHRVRVAPEGAVLVTVSNFPAAKIKQILDKAFAGWTGKGEKTAAPAPAFPSKPVTLESSERFEQSYLMIGYPAPAATDPDYAAIKVLNALLGSGMSSPLFQKVREEAGLAYEVSSFYPTRKLGSSFVVYAGTDPKNLEEAQKRINAMITEFLQNPVKQEDLDDAKRYIRGHYLMDHQTNRSLARYLGWWEILGLGHKHDTVYPEQIQRVTAEDVRRAGQTLLGRPVTVVKVRSKK